MTPGQVAYEAYNKAVFFENLPPWEAMSENQQQGWEATAQAVLALPSEEPQTIREWQKAIHDYAVGKGWWDNDNRTFGDLCILFASEISEAYEEYRNGHEVTETYFAPEKPEKPEGVPTELADCVIRILDYCQRVGIDLQAIMAQKHAFNLKRPYRHGGKRT